MARSFRRRAFGYSQAAVADAFTKLAQEHTLAAMALEVDLAGVRSKVSAASDRLRLAEAGLQQSDDRLRELVARATANITQYWRSIHAVMDRAAQTDAKLDAELADVKRTLAQFEEAQRQLGSDIGNLTRRYRETAAALRQAVPGQKE